MKKTLIGVAIFGAGIILSGCGKQAAPQNGAQQNQTQVQVQQDNATDSTIGSIKDAMGLGIKMKCEYSMGTGADTVKSVAYVEGKKYKSVSTVNGITMNSIFDGNAMYSWQDGQKTGMKMTMSCVEELNKLLPKDQQDSQEIKSPEESFKDAVDTSCVTTTESVNFSAPSNVTFNDQCEMMKKSIEMMKNAKLPAGVPANVPSVPPVQQ